MPQIVRNKPAEEPLTIISEGPLPPGHLEAQALEQQRLDEQLVSPAMQQAFPQAPTIIGEQPIEAPALAAPPPLPAPVAQPRAIQGPAMAAQAPVAGPFGMAEMPSIVSEAPVPTAPYDPSKELGPPLESLLAPTPEPTEDEQAFWDRLGKSGVATGGIPDISRYDTISDDDNARFNYANQTWSKFSNILTEASQRQAETIGGRAQDHLPPMEAMLRKVDEIERDADAYATGLKWYEGVRSRLTERAVKMGLGDKAATDFVNAKLEEYNLPPGGAVEGAGEGFWKEALYDTGSASAEFAKGAGRRGQAILPNLVGYGYELLSRVSVGEFSENAKALSAYNFDRARRYERGEVPLIEGITEAVTGMPADFGAPLEMSIQARDPYSLDWWGAMTGEQIPILVSMMAGAGVGAAGARMLGVGAKGQVAAARASALGLIGAQEGAAFFNASVQQLVDAGMSRDKATDQAVGASISVGIVNGLLELVPFEGIIMRNPAVRNRFMAGVRGLATEAPTEGMQELVSELGGMAIDLDSEIDWAQIMQSMAVGAVVGSGTATATHMRNNRAMLIDSLVEQGLPKETAGTIVDQAIVTAEQAAQQVAVQEEVEDAREVRRDADEVPKERVEPSPVEVEGRPDIQRPEEARPEAREPEPQPPQLAPEPQPGVQPEVLGAEPAPIAALPPAEAPAPAPPIADVPGAPTVHVLSPHEISVDPERFQFKIDVGRKGVRAEYDMTRPFDHLAAGPLAVWEDPQDGKAYVVNGHHRLEHAITQGVPSLNVLYIDAATAEEARAQGALLNIIQGRGTSVDAAKYLRDAGADPSGSIQKLKKAGADVSDALAREAIGLVSLSNELFQQVARGDMTPKRGAIIGRGLPNHADQQALSKAIEASKRKRSDDDVSEMVRLVESAPRATTKEETLFGVDEREVNLYAEKSALSNWVRKQLGRAKTTFKFASDAQRQAALEEAKAAQFDKPAAERLAGEAATAAYLYDLHSQRVGPVSDALNAAAESIMAGRPAKEVRRDLFRQVREGLQAIAAGEAAAVRPPDERGRPTPAARPGVAEAEPRPAEPAPAREEGVERAEPEEAIVRPAEGVEAEAVQPPVGREARPEGPRGDVGAREPEAGVRRPQWEKHWKSGEAITGASLEQVLPGFQITEMPDKAGDFRLVAPNGIELAVITKPTHSFHRDALKNPKAFLASLIATHGGRIHLDTELEIPADPADWKKLLPHIRTLVNAFAPISGYAEGVIVYDEAQADIGSFLEEMVHAAEHLGLAAESRQHIASQLGEGVIGSEMFAKAAQDPDTAPEALKGAIESILSGRVWTDPIPPRTAQEGTRFAARQQELFRRAAPAEAQPELFARPPPEPVAEDVAEPARFNLTTQDMRTAEAFTPDTPTEAFAAGVKRFMAGHTGVGRELVQQMSKAERLQAKRGFNAAKGKAAPVQREEAVRRAERAKVVEAPGAEIVPKLFSLSRKTSRLTKIPEGVNMPSPAASGKLVGKAERGPGEASPYAMSDPDMENRYQEARKGATRLAIGDRWKSWVEKMGQLFRRGALPHLKRTRQLGEARRALQAYKNGAAYANAQTEWLIGNTVNPLSNDDYDLFVRVVIMRDLQAMTEDHDYDSDAPAPLLPYGLTRETLAEEVAQLEASLADNVIANDAVNARQKWMKAVVADYVAANKAIGIDLSERFKRRNHFHHQVLYYMKLRQRERAGITTGVGARGRAEARLTRGFLKRRRGSELDINANYLQAEWEVAAQMIVDTERANALASIKTTYDIMPSLKDQARRHNFEVLVGGPEVVTRIEDLRDLIAVASQKSQTKAVKEELALLRSERDAMDPTQPMRKKMAIGISNLEKLREDGVAGIPDDLNTEAIVVLLDHANEEVAMAAGMYMKGIAERKALIRDTLGENFTTWADFVPDDHAEYQVRQGRPIFMAHTLPEKMATQLFEEAGKTMGISSDDLRAMPVLGQPYNPVVIPASVAKQLEEVEETHAKGIEGMIARGIATPMRWWKRWILTSPTRFIKYNIRNMSELDKAVALNPTVLKYMPKAVVDLTKLYRNRANAPKEVLDWVHDGGAQSLVLINEIEEVDQLKRFQHLLSQHQRKRGLAKIADVPARIWRGYWDKAGALTNWRESILRYAAYLDYLDQIKKSPDGNPRNFGGSNAEEVRGITNPRHKAFRLSADLLGDYSDLSVVGQFLRRYFYPFWSFQELNARTYIRGTLNIARNEGLAYKAGNKLAKSYGVARLLSPYMAIQLGKAAFLYYGGTALMAAYNRAFYPDEDDELPDYVKRTAHVVLGRDADGNVRYFSRLGTASDFLEWFGTDSLYYDYRDLTEGRRTLKEIAIDYAKSPLNKVVGGITPYVKTPAELLMGRAVWPDATNPHNIRDGMRHLARSMGVENEYVALTGKPSRGYADSLATIALYKVEPDKAAYQDFRDLVRKYKRAAGDGVGYSESQRGDALWHFRQAIRFKDIDAAARYSVLYFNLGGTLAGMELSLKSMAPMAGLSKKRQPDFLKSLRQEDRDLLEAAERYYEEALLGGKTPRAARAEAARLARKGGARVKTR